MAFQIPREVEEVAAELRAAGFEAYLVGGCVRDLLLGAAPKDWDVATNARPEEIERLFPESVYENQFGTVGVKTSSEDPAQKIIEVTTFRLEGKYTDKRHPDEVTFAKTIEEDLSRRDFTVNAMALRLESRNSHPESSDEIRDARYEIVDPFQGKEDLESRIIRTVGDPAARFNEDALRLMRAVRFSVELDFSIHKDTRRAIHAHAGLLEAIAKERIRDEFVKILMAPRAAAGIIFLEELNLLRHILPELREGLGVTQNKHHVYTVFEHNVRSLDYAAKQNYSLLVRTAALLHDVGKPKTKQGDGPDSTFYNHDRVGAKMAGVALDRLRFPREFVEAAAHLVRYHMFYYNVGEVTDAGVRRFLVRVGPETVPDLIKLREADRIGSGVPKAVPYKLRHFLFMIEKVKHDPISAKMLAVSGEDVMRVLGVPPGPRVGAILAVLLEELLDDPSRNDRERLESRMKELGALSDAELARLRAHANETKEEFESGMEEEMKKKFHVQ